MALEATFYGYVGTSNDALLIFEACRGNQLLQKVSRRPHDRERDRLIKSGNIFVFDEQSSGIRRWTDGVAWSPSRILGNYLIYRQLERPLQPGEKKRAQKRPGSMSRNGSAGELDDPDRMKAELADERTPSPRAAGGPIRGHKKIKTDSSSNSDNGSAPPRNKSKPWSDEQEKELAGSLTDSYGFKEGGLIKKTMSVEYEGTVHHLVSYYTIEDVMLSRLPAASSDPRLADLQIGGDLMTRTNFRVHPNSENGHSPGRSSPTQQRAQMMMQHGRRQEDPRHGPGYPVNYNSGPPPVHGNPPHEGYPDPNGHYAYGPGGQQPYQRYFPPQQPQYQPVYNFNGPPPPHMMTGPYYPPPPAQQPQYAPPPPHQMQHQPVDPVKREGPPNQQYYPAYNPYGGQQSHQPPVYQQYPPPQPRPQAPQHPMPPVNQQRPPYEAQQAYQSGPPEQRPPPPGAHPNAPPQQQGPPPGPSPPQPQRYEGPPQGGPPPQQGGPPPQPPPQQPQQGGNSPRPQVTAPAQPPNPPQPPQQHQQGGPPPQQNPGQHQAQPLSRNNSSGSPTPVQYSAPPPNPQLDPPVNVNWAWSQSQPSQGPPQPARA